jgi:hypothetical protein
MYDKIAIFQQDLNRLHFSGLLLWLVKNKGDWSKACKQTLIWKCWKDMIKLTSVNKCHWQYAVTLPRFGGTSYIT